MANPTSASAVLGEDLELRAGRSRAARLAAGLLMPALLAAFAAYLLVGMATMQVPPSAAFPGPRFFPGIIAAALLLLATLLAVEAIRGARRAEPATGAVQVAASGQPGEADIAEAGIAEADAAEPAAQPARRVRVDWASFAWVVGSFLAFVPLLELLGWVIAGGLLFWGVSRGFGAARPLQSLVAGLAVSSIAYIAFDMLLGMSLPSGLFGWGS
ncbi:tripartite tricarboxylate transporter TctB family protein [Agrococcus sp. SL85]|uniref:tripartite tricarboxylate transporter TctB family protein n=1 Tax=Agrococcus sp. SL85 TaxID=2995141 RepID=UPI00226D2E39|nr:tripartite tricarboxylate transporter TctB family protein [Agrococcus sp. SL85]WAC67355.1 tripartite tricarboxylate transporter TctB family protein [Agrococcus sp. SL85]